MFKSLFINCFSLIVTVYNRRCQRIKSEINATYIFSKLWFNNELINTYCYSLILFILIFASHVTVRSSSNYERYHIYYRGQLLASLFTRAYNKHGDIKRKYNDQWTRELCMMNNYGIQRQTIKKEYKEASWVTAAYCKPSPPLVELNRFLDRKLFRDKIDWPVLLAQLLANVPLRHCSYV